MIEAKVKTYKDVVENIICYVMLTEGNINPPFSLLSELVKTVLDMKDVNNHQSTDHVQCKT